MSTSKPRITVTLTERQHAVLRSLSKSSGQSMSALVVEFLDVGMPTLERMAAVMQALAESKAVEMGRIRDQLEEAQAVFEPLAALVARQGDLFFGGLHEALRAGPDAGGSPAARPARAPVTPATNQGGHGRRGECPES
jgi:hypothetical protein